MRHTLRAKLGDARRAADYHTTLSFAPMVLASMVLVMPNRVAVFGWSIDLAPGWGAELRQDSWFGETTAFLAVVPEVNDSLLRLTPDGRGIMAAAEWVEAVGRINRAKGRGVSTIRCGDFAGSVTQFISGDDWIRGWALCSGSSPLEVSYRCKATEVGRDDAAIDKMLSTLRVLARPVCGS